MSRTRSVLALLAGSIAALGAPLLWQRLAPAPAHAQSSQSPRLEAAFALSGQEWVVVNERGDVTVYTKNGTIIRRCLMRTTAASVIDCRNQF